MFFSSIETSPPGGAVGIAWGAFFFDFFFARPLHAADGSRVGGFFFARPLHAADGSRVGGFFFALFLALSPLRKSQKQPKLSFTLTRSLASLSLIDRSKRKSFGSSIYAQEYGQRQGYMSTVAILAQGK